MHPQSTSLSPVAEQINSRRAALAEEILNNQYQRQPELAQRYTETQRQACLWDIQYTLGYLSQSLEYISPALFIDYAVWLYTVLHNRGLPAEDLTTNLSSMGLVLRGHFPQHAGEIEQFYLQPALQAIQSVPGPGSSLIDPQQPHSDLAVAYLRALLDADRQAAVRLVMNAVQAGRPVKDIYLHVFQPTQREIGRLWQFNQIDVGQEHYATAVTQMVMSQLYPLIFSTERVGHSLVATCVGSELHEIGIRMVADFFEMAGWDTYYLGANTPAASIIRAVKEHNAGVLAISATLTTHIGDVRKLIQAVRQSEAGQVGILVGGYPFNLSPHLWQRVGADGFARDAQGAIAAAQRLVEGE
jgi:MerR family transcriptional regulator, light-induced transcriptional regulator